MFLRHKIGRKNGKEHRYWSIVENRRECPAVGQCSGMCYTWAKSTTAQKPTGAKQLKCLTTAANKHRELALFPADRAVPEHACDMACRCV